MGAGALASTLISLAVSAGVSVLQRRKLAQQREKQLDSTAQELRETPSGAPVPLCYGRTIVEGILSYYTVGDRFNYAPTTNVFGSLPPRNGKKNEYFLGQYTLCVGEIDKVLAIWNGPKSVTHADFNRISLVEWNPGTGVASELATAFTGYPTSGDPHPDTGLHGVGNMERTATDKFAGLAYCTFVAKHERENPQFFGPPTPLCFVKGKKLRKLTSSGSLAGTAYTNISPVVLLDYLLDRRDLGTSVDYGPGLRLSEIDTSSFYDAQQVADEVVFGSGSDVWGEDFPSDWNEQLGTSYSDIADYLRELGFGNINVLGMSNTAFNPTTDPVTVVNRYEFNGNISTAREFPTAIDQIMGTMPGAKLFRDSFGKWTLRLPKANAAVSTQVVATIDKDKLITPVSEQWAPTEGKLNSKTVRFSNANKEFSSDSITFPARSTGATRTLTQEVERTHTVPASSFQSSANGSMLQNSSSTPMPSAIMADPDTRAYLNSVFAFSNGNIAMYFSDTVNDATLGFSAGPELSSDFEANGTVTFLWNDGSELEVTPFGDSTEPYSYNVGATKTTARQAIPNGAIMSGVRFTYTEEVETEESIDSETAALDTLWLGQDGGIRLHSTETLDGVHNQYAALSLAANEILVSRRRLYSWTMAPSGYLLEPGDVVTLDDETTDLEATVRVETLRVTDDFNIEVTAVEYVPSDYQWWPDANAVYEQQLLSTLTLAPPTGVSAAINGFTVEVEFQPPLEGTEDVRIREYEIEVALNSEPWRLWTKIQADPLPDGVTEYQAIWKLVEDADTSIQFRIRSSAIGRVGEWQLTGEIDLSTIDIGQPITSVVLDGQTLTITYEDGSTDDVVLPITTPGDDVLITSVTQNAVGGVIIVFSDGASITIPPGAAGKGIQSIVRDDDTGIVTVTYDVDTDGDGTNDMDTFTVSDGRDGTDGNAAPERIFTRYSSSTLPTSKHPLDSWGYDQPGTVDDQVWTDGHPGGTADEPWVFVSQRPVTGVPMVGDAVPVSWSTPRVDSHYGVDGSGFEQVWLLTNAETMGVPDLPMNIPQTESDRLANVNDGIPLIPTGVTNEPGDLTSTNKYRWRSFRTGKVQSWGAFSQWALDNIWTDGITNTVRDPVSGIVSVTYESGKVDSWTVAAGTHIQDVDTLASGAIEVTFDDGQVVTIPAGQAGRGIDDVDRRDNRSILVVWDDGEFDVSDIDPDKTVSSVTSSGAAITVNYSDSSILVFQSEHTRSSESIDRYEVLPKDTAVFEFDDGTFQHFLLPSGRGVQSFSRNEVTGEVRITYTDGTMDDFLLPDSGDGVRIRNVAQEDDGDVVLTFSDDTDVRIPHGAAGRGINTVTRDGATGTVTFTFDDGSDPQTFLVADGKGINSVSRNDATGVVSVTYSDNSTDTFTINDGNDGNDGDPGIGVTSATVNDDRTVTLTFGNSSADLPNITIPAGVGIRSVARDADTGVVTVTYDDDDDSPSIDTFTILDGVAGADGNSTISLNTGAEPDSSVGEDGDSAIVTGWADTNIDARIYSKASGSWTERSVIRDGNDGNTWHTGTGVPMNNAHNEGDFYVDTATSSFYEKTGAMAWTLRGNLKGADGSKWLSASDGMAPAAATGANGDFAFVTGFTGQIDAKIYFKSGGSWAEIAQIIDGADANTWHSGAGAPANTLGEENDFYLNTNNGEVWEKGETAWAKTALDLTGPAGAAGSDGTDGKGYEWIFARTANANAPTTTPNNNWAYDSPASPWSDAAPALNSTNPYLWRSQRTVEGDGSTAAQLGNWSSPVIVGRFGVDGSSGARGARGLQGISGNDGSDGDPGEDGKGYEWIFARTSGTTPSAPSNAWSYDSPSNPWSDAAPTLTATNNTLWQAQRTVEGDGSTAAQLGDWTTPKVVSRYGDDGDDGRGISSITKSGETLRITLSDNSQDTFTVPNGAAGPRGVDGSAGVNGISTYTGLGDPVDSFGSDGDFYLDIQQNLTLYQKLAGSWVLTLDRSGSVYTKPGAPTGLTVSVIRTTSGSTAQRGRIEIGWTAPAQKGGAQEGDLRYDVAVYETNSATERWTPTWLVGATIISGQTRAILNIVLEDSLTTGTSFYIRVRCSPPYAGTSVWSNWTSRVSGSWPSTPNDGLRSPSSPDRLRGQARA